MLEENKLINIPGIEAIEVLKAMDYLVVSLDKIGSYYYDPENITDDVDKRIEQEIGRFIIDNKVLDTLANARALLSAKFNRELGEDDMDDVERATEETIYWGKPGD